MHSYRSIGAHTHTHSRRQFLMEGSDQKKLVKKYRARNSDMEGDRDRHIETERET